MDGRGAVVQTDRLVGGNVAGYSGSAAPLRRRRASRSKRRACVFTPQQATVLAPEIHGVERNVEMRH